MPNQGSSPSEDYTAPVSEEERQAWIGVFDKKYHSPEETVPPSQSLPASGVGVALLYLGIRMILREDVAGFVGFFTEILWEVGGFMLCVVGGFIAVAGLVVFFEDPEKRKDTHEKLLRKGVIVNRILNTHMDVLVRKYAQCSQVDEYGHKRFDDDRWQKEETKFRDTVWVPEASKFMSGLEIKSYLEHQDPLVNIVEAAYEGRTTGIIATFREDMNPFDYEHFCAAILNENGWNARATQGSGDQGVDVIAEKDACRVAIQCKLYSSNVGNKAVQEIIAGSIHVDADYRVVVSNRDYTKSAYEIAEKSKVRLLHHNDLQDLDRALGLASV